MIRTGWGINIDYKIAVTTCLGAIVYQGKPSNCSYLIFICKVNLTYTKFKVQNQKMGSFFGIEGISDCSYEAASSVLATKQQRMWSPCFKMFIMLTVAAMPEL